MKKIALVSSFLSLMFFVSLAIAPVFVFAQAEGTKTTTTTQTSTPNISFQLKNPLGSSTTLDGFLAKILDAIVLLLSPVVVIMLLYSGFLFVTAQGKAEEITKAKQALIYTLIGAAIVLGAKGLAEVIKNTVSCLASNGSC
jgi:hypothetical protein